MTEICTAPELTNGHPPDMTRLVRILAARVLARLPRDCGIELSDLIQAGNIGLLRAERTYSPQYGAPLSGYAKFRIRGEMLDAVRRNSKQSRTGVTVQGSTGDDGKDLEGMLPASPECSPHAVFARTERAEILGDEVARLPERYRNIVRLRYEGDFALREIGEAIGLHESRVCQLHQTAMGRLRRALMRRGVRCASVLLQE
jgi:RNA polymerase sigma factor FliA